MALSIIDQSSRNMHHIKAEYFLFHVVYVTQFFVVVRYDSYCNVSTHIYLHNFLQGFSCFPPDDYLEIAIADTILLSPAFNLNGARYRCVSPDALWDAR